MGLVRGVLLGPIGLVAWTAGRILEAAEREQYDEDQILSALGALNDQYDRGLIDDATFAAAEDRLIQRLEVARTRRAR